jgi:beta-glucanase (GH16 family)
MTTWRLGFGFAFAMALLLVPAVGGAEEWKLVWSDEFDYQGLPDPNKWGYEEGFVRNNEAQYYTKARKENARVENGVLIIEGRKEQFANAGYNPDAKSGSRSRATAEYTAASLITKNKADWTFGRVEVRAKLPQGKGVWPAIWMLGTKGGWPAGGEIDIMEFVGHMPDYVHATVHYQKEGKHQSSGSKLKVDRPFDDFHVYAVEWFPDHMDFYFDQTKYHTFAIEQADNGKENPFRKPQYLLINLAIGGGWGGAIDPSIFPQKYLIDYVRVYKGKSE